MKLKGGIQTEKESDVNILEEQEKVESHISLVKELTYNEVTGQTEMCV